MSGFPVQLGRAASRADGFMELLGRGPANGWADSHQWRVPGSPASMHFCVLGVLYTEPFSCLLLGSALRCAVQTLVCSVEV